MNVSTQCLQECERLKFEEICWSNSSYKTGSIKNGCLFLINMPNVLSTHMQANIFLGPCHGVSSVGPIHPVVGYDTMKKFLGKIHLIKLVQ